MSSVDCKAKYIDRNHVKIAASANLSEPLHEIWVHVEPYYKFNRYTRIAGYIWENLCDWLAGKKSFILDYYGSRLMKFTNINHTCPYSGNIFGKIDNISIQAFAFPQILPSGRYFIDMIGYESDRSKVLSNLQIYFSVSDHRIEIV